MYARKPPIGAMKNKIRSKSLKDKKKQVILVIVLYFDFSFLVDYLINQLSSCSCA